MHAVSCASLFVKSIFVNIANVNAQRNALQRTDRFEPGGRHPRTMKHDLICSRAHANAPLRRQFLLSAACVTAVPALATGSSGDAEQNAALAAGLHADARFDANAVGLILVTLDAAQKRITPLFQAIPERQCTRGDYDGQPISQAELRQLEQAGAGNGVSVKLLAARPAMESVLEYVVAGNTVQMNDPAFVAELKAWIRFGSEEALRTGDGLFAGASGNAVLPRGLGGRLMGLFFTPKSENERYARQIRNSAGIAAFVSERSDKAHWVEAGRCYQRFALQATALGIRNAFLNQPVEAGAVRPQFAVSLGLASHQRPDLVVRFGARPRDAAVDAAPRAGRFGLDIHIA